MKKDNLKLHGGNRIAYESKEEELVLSGGYQTGKTVALLKKIDDLCTEYPNLNILITRKYLQNLKISILLTFENIVLPVTPEHSRSIVKKFSKASGTIIYKYPNGSKILVCSLNRIPPSELFDFIYVNQCEEITENNWEYLKSRLNTRDGKLPFVQICGDANPADPKPEEDRDDHWIIERGNSNTLTLIHSQLKDNPTIYDQTKKLFTVLGEKSREHLEQLRGTNKQRYYYGQWV